jgi:hypothetical protein
MSLLTSWSLARSPANFLAHLRTSPRLLSWVLLVGTVSYYQQFLCLNSLLFPPSENNLQLSAFPLGSLDWLCICFLGMPYPGGIGQPLSLLMKQVCMINIHRRRALFATWIADWTISIVLVCLQSSLVSELALYDVRGSPGVAAVGFYLNSTYGMIIH